MNYASMKLEISSIELKYLIQNGDSSLEINTNFEYQHLLSLVISTKLLRHELAIPKRSAWIQRAVTIIIDEAACANPLELLLSMITANLNHAFFSKVHVTRHPGALVSIDSTSEQPGDRSMREIEE